MRLTSILMLSLFAVLTLAACTDSSDLMAKWQSTESSAGPKHDITKEDIFSLQGIKGDQVTVFDVGLGDNKERAIAKLGEPDNVVEFPEIDTYNFEYNKRLGMNGTGLVVQISGDKVSKITVKQPFNKYLHGSTVIDNEVSDVYFRLLGLPDSQEDHPSRLRIFRYEDEGFEVFIRRRSMNGFSIVSPRPISSPKRQLSPEELAALNGNIEG